jgi:hypothetical protein
LKYFRFSKNKKEVDQNHETPILKVNQNHLKHLF